MAVQEQLQLFARCYANNNDSNAAIATNLTASSLNSFELEVSSFVQKILCGHGSASRCILKASSRPGNRDDFTTAIFTNWFVTGMESPLYSVFLLFYLKFWRANVSDDSNYTI
jgi:hypothetical protein